MWSLLILYTIIMGIEALHLPLVGVCLVLPHPRRLIPVIIKSLGLYIFLIIVLLKWMELLLILGRTPYNQSSCHIVEQEWSRCMCCSAPWSEVLQMRIQVCRHQSFLSFEGISTISSSWCWYCTDWDHIDRCWDFYLLMWWYGITFRWIWESSLGVGLERSLDDIWFPWLLIQFIISWAYFDLQYFASLIRYWFSHRTASWWTRMNPCTPMWTSLLSATSTTRLWWCI